MGRWDGSKFAENKRRREFLLLGIAGGAGVIALAALGVAKKGGGGGVSGTGVAPKIPFWSSSSTLGNSTAQYIAADPSISPTSDNAVDLGKLTLRWRSGYFGGSVFTNIIDTGSSQLNLITGGQGAQIDGPINPSSDNLYSLGIQSKRWTVVYLSSSVRILGTISDANPQTQLGLQSLAFGAGGASAVDVTLSRINATELDLNADLNPTVALDNAKTLGQPAQRWRAIQLGDSVRIFAASGDANNATRLSNGELDFGPGGATAVDVYLKRISAGLWETQAIRPQTNNAYDLGTSILGWRDNWISGELHVQSATTTIGGQNLVASFGSYIGVNGLRISGGDNTNSIYQPSGSLGLSAESGDILIMPNRGSSGGAVKAQTDNSTDLGTSALRWRTVYSPIVNSGASDLTLTPNVAVVPATDNAKDLGTSALRWRNLEVLNVENPSGTLQLIANAGLSNISANCFGFLPNADNTSNLGSSSKRWANLYLSGASLHILGAASDANDTTTLKSGELDFGPGGVTAVDTKITRTGSGNIKLTNSGDTGELRINSGSNTPALDFRPTGTSKGQIYHDGSNMSVRAVVGTLYLGDGTVDPQTDNVGNFGANNQRWVYINAASGFRLFSGSGDANPISQLLQSELDFGAGGASAVDVYLKRISAGLWETQAIRPQTDNTYDLGTSAPLGWRDFYLSGKIKRYNAIVTAAFGVPAIVAEGDLTGQTGTVASVAAYTVGAANGVFKVGGDIDVTAFTSGTINLQVTYTDWNSGTQTVTIDSVALLADAPGNEVTIMAKASTSITVKTTGTFTATYNVAATIIQVK